MAMWVVQAHREGRWATWGLQGLDLVIQRSGMGAVPSCTRAGLPMVAGRGSEVRGKSDKGDKPRKGEAQRWAGVHEGAQGCVKVHRGVQRCTEGCVRGCTSHEGARLAKKQVHIAAHKLENDKNGLVRT